MKNVLFTAVFCIIMTCGVSVYGQCVQTSIDPCVVVNQSLINKAGEVADKLRAAQDVIAKFQNERQLSVAEREAASVLIQGLRDLAATKDKIISEYERINELWKKAFDFQQVIIERLEKALNKPRSGFQKFLSTLKEIALVLAGVLVGRGF